MFKYYSDNKTIGRLINEYGWATLDESYRHFTGYSLSGNDSITESVKTLEKLSTQELTNLEANAHYLQRQSKLVA